MKSFKITDKIEIVCEYKSTRSGFKHIATLLIDGCERDSAKCCYQNRTWERYEYESVLKNLVNKTEVLTEEEKKICNSFINKDNTDWSAFKAVSMVAAMGELLCKDKKEKNDWKARMIKAGLGDKGLEMPEDWETLDEDTKQAGLNSVLKVIGEVGNKN